MKFRQLGEYKKVAPGELDLVTGVCADAFVVKQRDITRHWRGAIDVCEARQLAMWFLRERGHTFKAIARAFHKKDHATAMHGVNRVKSMLAINDRRFSRRWNIANAALKGEAPKGYTLLKEVEHAG